MARIGITCGDSPIFRLTDLEIEPTIKIQDTANKSAHTALAVTVCLLGGISYTKCSMTFVNIAVAISALAGGMGGSKNGFAPRPGLGGVSEIFRRFLGV